MINGFIYAGLLAIGFLAGKGQLSLLVPFIVWVVYCIMISLGLVVLIGLIGEAKEHNGKKPWLNWK